MRAWLSAAVLSLSLAMPVAAATRVTIHDLKDAPELYYGQTVELQCYYDKESPIWVRALPDAEEWIGFFVTGKPEKTLTWSGEYYNLLFAPYAMRTAVRSLRGGDAITVSGEVFHYHSASFEGAGIRVQQLFSGWGPSAKLLGTAADAQVASSTAAATDVSSTSPRAPATPQVVAEKYTATINGKRYEGLRIGDRYNFDGIEFQVDPAQP